MINLDKNSVTVEFKDRFNLVRIDDFIETKFFYLLRDKYPSDENFQINTKYALTLNDKSRNFHNFLQNETSWSDLIRAIDDDVFKKKILRIFKIKNVFFSDKSWKRFFPFFKKVKFEYTFNKSKNGSFNEPHTDSTRKIVSMIIFFTNDDWNINNGGLVKLFTPIKKKDEDNWRNKLIDEKDLKTIKEIFPKPNRFYGFKKTKNSYHSVSKVNCNEEDSRNVLMINLSYANENEIPYSDETIIKKILKKIFKKK